ncbi:MAG TPA: hypothetical protein VHB02_03845 [Acidimicrobiales bacterium]|nr:hypothetical protein [Acidimicrobiales bacterium]
MSGSLTATLVPTGDLQDWQSQWEVIQRRATAIQAQRPSDLDQASLMDADADYQRFLMQAWHLRDYLKRIPTLKPTVDAKVDSEPSLLLLADLADSIKHGRGRRRNPKSGIDPVLRPATGDFAGPMRTWHLKVTILHGPMTIDGIQFVRDVIAAWTAVLTRLGLI